MKPADFITRTIDFFYVKPLRKIVPLQTFRYAVCGAANMALGWVVYWFVFHYIVGGRWIDLGFVDMSPRTTSLLIQIPVTFLTGFWLNRHVTFTMSPLRGTTQFVRYIIQVSGSFLLIYLLMRLFTDVINIYPTVARPIADLVSVIYSYLMARFFTFRGAGGKSI